jgi:hypothetical protein
MALAKNLAQSRDESRSEPGVRNHRTHLPSSWRAMAAFPPSGRQVVRTIGQALLTAASRVRPHRSRRKTGRPLGPSRNFERLYARLADEYEHKERAQRFPRKLRIISETTSALTDLIDTGRSLRLEATIVALIVVEVIHSAVRAVSTRPAIGRRSSRADAGRRHASA